MRRLRFTGSTTLLALVALLATIPTEVHAHQERPATPDGWIPDPPRPDCDAPEGDPVTAYSGEWWHRQTDLVVPGVFPIRMERKYRSRATYDSPLGYGWAFTYDRRLFKYPDGTIVIRRGCGERLRFIPAGGSFVNPPLIQGTLVEHPNGTHTFTLPRGTRHEFDVEGRLVAIEDSQGNRLEMTYAPEKVPLTGTSPFAVDPSQPMVVAHVYQLERIAERTADGSLTGRFVDLTYDANTGRLTSISASDGRSVSYSHDVHAGTGLTTGNLVRVDGLEEILTTYDYEDPDDSHNVTSFESGGVRPITNLYADDRVATQEFGGSTYAFAYQNVPTLETTVTRTVRDPEGSTLHVRTTTYEFDPDGYLLKTLDALGNEVVLTRNAQKQITRDETYENQGTPADPDLQLTRRIDFTYNLKGDTTSRATHLSSGEILTESWTYDQGWVASEQTVSSLDPGKPFGTFYTFERSGPNPDDPITGIDEIKRVTAWDTQTPPQPTAFQVTSFDYDSATGQIASITPPEVTPADNLRIVRRYHGPSDAHPGLPREIELEVGASPDLHLKQTFTYDPNGFLASTKDARDHTTSYDRDDLGRLTKVTNAAQESTLYTYSGPNHELSDPNLAPAGHLLAIVERGRTAAEGEGQVQLRRWDAMGRLVRIERKDAADAYQTFVIFTLDSDGNRLSETDGEGRATHFTYDVLGRLERVTDPAGNPPTLYGYDGRGNRTSATDSRSVETLLFFDAADRLTGITEDPTGLGLVTTFDLDAVGNVTKVTDPKAQETDYAYDRLSRLETVTQELGQAVTYTYDARGRLSTKINARGNVLRSFYEPWGGLERVEHYADGQAAVPDRTISYRYDLNGNLVSTSDTDFLTGVAPDPSDPVLFPADRLYSFTHDALDRLDVVTAHYIPGGDRSLDSSYDRFGNRNALDFSDGGTLSHAWAFNDFNQLTSASLPGAAAIQFEYFGNDDLKKVTRGSGVVAAYTYHPEGPIDLITVTGPGSAVLSLDYGINEIANVTSVAEARDGGAAQTTTYGHDDIGRLTSADYPPAFGLPSDQGYTYDAAGNREDPNDANLYHYDPNNRILSSPGDPNPIVYESDDDGNITTRADNGATRTHTWDYTNRLRQIVDSATGTTDYDYDPFSRRILKQTSGISTYYLWDGDALLAEYDGSGDRTVRYAYAASFAPTQVAYNDGAGGEDVYDLHEDHLETPRVLTDSAGAAVWRASYEAFGIAVLDAPNLHVLNLRFPGQYHDQESGLHYNRFRYYSPHLGRYVAKDPLAELWNEVPSANSLSSSYGKAWIPFTPIIIEDEEYIYASNDPILLMDPLGLAIVFPEALPRLFPSGGSGSPGSPGSPGGPLLPPGPGDSCPPPKPRCWFVGERYFGGETKTCIYRTPGGMFTFPQWKDKPCPPIDPVTCMVDTTGLPGA